MVRSYARAASAREAVEAKARDPGIAFLAGGTQLLAMASSRPMVDVIDIGSTLDRSARRSGSALVLGAGLTFQDLAEPSASMPALPPALIAAAKSMANRNIRVRATLGGNLAALRSCASLAPVLLALGATVHVMTVSGEKEVPLSDWYGTPEGLVLSTEIPDADLPCGFARWARTSCDLSVLTASVSPTLDRGTVKSAVVACGGLSSRPRRFQEVESLLAGVSISAGGAPISGATRDELESRIASKLTAIDDVRGSAAFKRREASVAIVSALFAAVGFSDGKEASR